MRQISWLTCFCLHHQGGSGCQKESLQGKSAQADSDAEFIEAEVVDDEMPSGAAGEEKKITVIQQQTNVIQNGDHNVNLTNNGTINFHFLMEAAYE